MPKATSLFGKATMMAGAAAVMVITAGTALADDPPPPRPPNCTAADLAEVLTGVTAATAAYLRAHPDVNDFLTNVEGPDKEEVRRKIDAFFDTHPWVRGDWQAIRKPADDFRARCGIIETP